MKTLEVSRVRVRDFQALRKVDLDLGPLTIIVGPSDVGKSSLLRAVRALAQNAFSLHVIPPHARRSVVEVEFGDGHVVALERGRQLSKYVLDGEEFPKAGTSVPAEVERVVRLSEASFASQFDPPFLLMESSTVVGQVLGTLTGANRLLAALREAGRRRLEVMSRLKVRRSDLERLEAREEEVKEAERFAEQVAVIRSMVEEAAEAEAEVARLRAGIARVEAAQREVERLEALPVVEVDLSEVEALSGEYVTLSETLARVEAAMSAEQVARSALVEVEGKAEALDEEYHRLLTEAGTCPVCGQEVPRRE